MVLEQDVSETEFEEVEALIENLIPACFDMRYVCDL